LIYPVLRRRQKLSDAPPLFAGSEGWEVIRVTKPGSVYSYRSSC